MNITVSYTPAQAGDMNSFRSLILEYLETLSLDLDFQDIQHELSSLPGKYAEPEGSIVLAKAGSVTCGCVALRRIDKGCCEMKRLFVKPEYRSLGIGKRLVELIIADGIQKKYRCMRLDTLVSMKSAVELYTSYGFYPIEPYIFNPLPGALFFEKRLS